jgi:uncharacterized membrane protein
MGDQEKTPKTAKYLFWLLNAMLAVAFVADLAAPQGTALDAVLIVLAAVASVAALSAQLPLQNVLPAALIAAAFGGFAHGLTTASDIALPFGPITFNSDAGGKIFNAVPWIIPLIWVIVIFNARGVARLILRPWRRIKNYGFWLIGLTAVLAVAFDVALEPYAWHVKHLWLWQPTKIAITWHGASPLNFLGWAFVSLLILAFATPSLIRKQPGASGKPDFHPLFVWLGALILFGTGSAQAGLWPAVAADAAIAAVTASFAYRGAKW